MELIKIGTVSTVKGLDGSMIISGVPRGITVLNAGISIQIGFSKSFAKEFTLAKWIRLPNHAMIVTKEITSPETAEQYKEQGVFVDKSVLKKNSGNILDSEWIGFEAIDSETNKTIGKITDVWELPASDIITITSDDAEYTVPVVEEFISDIDEENRKIFVKIIEGMKNLNADNDNLVPDDIEEDND